MDEITIEVPNNSGPVLSVDDDPQFHELLRMAYRRSSLANTFVPLSSSASCLEYMKRSKATKMDMPALLLVDANMPNIDGYKLVELIRKDPRFKHNPKIVVLSTFCGEADIELSRWVGADEYREKPMRIFDLRFVGGHCDDRC